jgi:hypothetical protein
MKHVFDVIRAHPATFLNLVSTFAAHPEAVPALATLLETGDILGFAKAHQDVAIKLFVQLAGELQAHPDLLSSMLEAVAAHQTGAA